MSNWKKVFSSSQLAVASMVSGILMEQQIQTIGDNQFCTFTNLRLV